MATHFTYADGTMLTFEVRSLGSFGEGGGGPCGDSVFGTKGYYVRDVGFFDYRNNPIPIDDAEHPKPKSAGSFGNFLKAVRTRKIEDIHGNPEQGHISCAHIHLGNIAFRLQRSLVFDPAAGMFVGDDEANAYLKRDYRKPFEVPEIA